MQIVRNLCMFATVHRSMRWQQLGHNIVYQPHQNTLCLSRRFAVSFVKFIPIHYDSIDAIKRCIFCSWVNIMLDCIMSR